MLSAFMLCLKEKGLFSTQLLFSVTLFFSLTKLSEAVRSILILLGQLMMAGLCCHIQSLMPQIDDIDILMLIMFKAVRLVFLMMRIVILMCIICCCPLCFVFVFCVDSRKIGSPWWQRGSYQTIISEQFG